MFTKSIAGALLSIVLATQGQAQARDLEIATSVFCDTQAEMERFVALFDGDTQTAINAVNAEAKDPTACVAATIAFVRGAEVATVRTWNETFHIVQMTVIGVLTATGPRPAGPAITFSIRRVEERDA